MVTLKDVIRIPVRDIDDVSTIIENTANTWQKDRDISEKTRDTRQGKITEQAFRDWFCVRGYRYVTYDSFRDDNGRCAAPFDGLICVSNQNIDIAIQKIRQDVRNHDTPLSEQTRKYLCDNFIKTVEIKSTKISEKILQRTANIKEALQIVISENHFLTYPTKLRYSKKDITLQQYMADIDNLYDFEQRTKADIHVHIYVHDTYCYLIGYLLCADFFSQPLLTRFFLANKSEYALYFAKPLKEGRPLSRLIDDIYSPINNVQLGDCMSLLETLSDESVDLVIADPPYYQIKGDFDFVWKTKEEYLEWCRTWLRECRRVLKHDGTLMLWGGLGKKQIMLCRLAIMIEDEDIFTRQNWITQRNTRGIGTQQNYMSAREDLLFLTKSDDYTFNVPFLEEKSQRKDLGANGKPRTNEYKRVSNVWSDIAEASQSSKERCEHPTVKAQKLCDRIIQTHSNPGDLILIPFAGSGSECAATLRNNRNYLATEIDFQYWYLCQERIPKLRDG